LRNLQEYSLAKSPVLGRVFLGLFGSLLLATAGVYVGQFVPPFAFMVLMVAELVMIIAAMFIQRKRSIGYGFVYAFTFISGITLYPTIAHYTMLMGPAPVIKALAVTAGAFFISSFVASRSSLDFSFLGGFLFVGLIAILLMGVISIFIPFSTMTSLVYSLIGIGIFVGYVLFDVNRIARMGIAESEVPWMVLSLYLDFINLFLFVLRLMGILESDNK
jgi:uncharacterized protein